MARNKYLIKKALRPLSLGYFPKAKGKLHKCSVCNKYKYVSIFIKKKEEKKERAICDFCYAKF
jgi:transcription elongation factor Elf1